MSDVTGLVEGLDRIAVVGVNGAGKSTLLKMIAQEAQPSEGEVAWLSPSSAASKSRHPRQSPNSSVLPWELQKARYHPS